MAGHAPAPEDTQPIREGSRWNALPELEFRRDMHTSVTTVRL
jgi:hypothetical protein